MTGGASGFRPSAEFVLLTGALGSGKTTLLSEHLRSGDMSDTGVIVNDAGEVNVDGAVIGADHRGLNLATLGDGCICCSLGNGVQDGIDALLLARAERGMAPMRRVILETSGLAEPAPILRGLRQVRQASFRLRIVATFDASRSASGEAFLPQYAAQLAAAHAIVATKLDLVPGRGEAELSRAVGRFNPIARLIATADSAGRADRAFREATPETGASPGGFFAREADAPRISVLVARWDGGVGWDGISEWIDNVAGYAGDRLLRAKGFLRPSDVDGRVLVDGVGGVFAPARSMAAGASDDDEGLVMILRDMDPAELAAAAGDAPRPELRMR